MAKDAVRGLGTAGGEGKDMKPSRVKSRGQGEASPCIWMQAGVVRKKICTIHYDCPSCRFDAALHNAARQNQQAARLGRLPVGRRGRIVYWKERLMALPQWKRPCLHHMKGRIGFRACTAQYRCGNCQFDQYFTDHYTVHALVRPVGVLNMDGFKFPQGFYLHPGHAWVRVEEGGSVAVGLDDFALRVFGPLDRIEAPLLGKELEQERGDIWIVRGGLRAQVRSPVGGVVTAVNTRLGEQGARVGTDPYTEGWIARVHPDNLRQNLKKLMLGEEARDFIRGETSALYGVIEEAAGPLAADGGLLADDICGKVPRIGWDRLTRMFLRTQTPS